MMVSIAVLWDSVTWEGNEPSEYEPVNPAYRVFSQLAREKGGRVYMAHYSWYRDGALDRAFCFRDGEWRRVEEVDVDVVFDKSDMSEDSREVKKRVSEELPVINDYRLQELVNDKLESYRSFPDHIPETREADREDVEEMLDDYGRVVLKPRSDYGGTGVEVINSIDDFEPREGLLVQRFVDPTEGLPGFDVSGPHDLRIQVLSGDPAGAQVRVPESGWVSNVHRGGETFFVELEDVPDRALEIVEEVAEVLSAHDPSFYSVDFVFDRDGRPWILELNSKPGLVFYGSEELEESKKKLMEKVVEELVDAV
ncbi:MAG: RimK family alpha-L-glutamate ligase [Candidatus Nanohaloarchaea archaeon]